jgi:hypothetical protein
MYENDMGKNNCITIVKEKMYEETESKKIHRIYTGVRDGFGSSSL